MSIQKSLKIKTDHFHRQNNIAAKFGLTWEQWAREALEDACNHEEYMIKLREQKEDEKFRSE